MGSASWALSYVHLGSWSFAIALSIALVKGAIVALVFMELIEAPASSNVAILAAVALCRRSSSAFTLADVATRGAPPTAPPRLHRPRLRQAARRGRRAIRERAIAKDHWATVSRTVLATLSEVFDVVFDAKSPGRPPVRRRARDPERVSSTGFFTTRSATKNRDWAHYGRFVQLDRPGVIEHTWVSEATQGLETTVTVTLEPKGADTVLTLRHTNVPDDPMGRRHQDGWTFVVGAIADRFAARPR